MACLPTRLSKRIVDSAEPAAQEDFLKVVNPKSLEVVTAKLETSLATAKPDERYQFERLGYFCLDIETEPSRPVFSRTISLKDTWAKVQARG